MIKTININSKEYTIEFKDQDIKLINEYINITDRIWTMVEDIDFKTNVSLNFTLDGAMKKDVVLPRDKDIASVLHSARLLILPRERTYLPKIKNIILKNIQDKSLEFFLKTLVKNFKILNTLSNINLKFEDIDLIDESIFFEWLNAYEFHGELTKQEKLRIIIDKLGKDYFKSLMIGILITKVDAIFGFATLLKEVITHHSSVINFSDNGTAYKVVT